MTNLSSIPNNILVLGLAKSGTAAASTLLQHGKRVRVNDLKGEDEKTMAELRDLGAEIIIGSHPLSVLDGVEMVVKNPGIPYDHPLVEEAQRLQLPIVTEIEIAYLLSTSPIVAVTGSNGKTTTTTIIGEMLDTPDRKVKVAGNIGTVAIDVVQQYRDLDHLILELSSFQLLGIESFRPHIAVLLNLYEAHLDYHKSLDNYQAAKENIFKNQRETDFLIYNADDPKIVSALPKAKSNLIPFSVSGHDQSGAWADEEAIYYKEEKIMDRRHIALVGRHNLENILASVAVAKLCQVDHAQIRKVLSSFSGVKHRLQYVTSKQGRKFYNDSKATNILATERALASFTDPVILIAGGLDRGNEFTDLIPALKKLRGIVTYGETAEKLASAAREAGVPFVRQEKNLEAAVTAAYEYSREEDIILLSPACASWDEFTSFEERGDMFIEAVHNLS